MPKRTIGKRAKEAQLFSITQTFAKEGEGPTRPEGHLEYRGLMDLKSSKEHMGPGALVTVRSSPGQKPRTS